MRFPTKYVMGVVALLGATSAASAAVINPGFESGLTGWTTIGTVAASGATDVTTFDGTIWSVIPYETTSARLDAGSASAASIEAALGLPSGILPNPNGSGGSLTDGSAIYQSFAGTAGDVVGSWWNYVATDYIPFNDPAYAILIDPIGGFSITTLASIHGAGIPVGTSGNSGWHYWSETLGLTGSYTLAFVTTNDKDTILDSVLFLDNGEGSCDPTCVPLPDPNTEIPEPGTLSLLGLSLAGLVAARRRRRSAA